MRTVITCGRPVGIIAHELTPTEAYQIRGQLAAQGIHVVLAADIDHVLHIYPTQPVTTAQEVTALRAFADVTDARLAWHPIINWEYAEAVTGD